MAKLTLDASQTAILQAVFASLEPAYFDGVEVDGAIPELDLDPSYGYNDDSKMGGGDRADEMRLLTKQTACRDFAALIKNSGALVGASIIPQITANNIPGASTSSATFADLASFSFNQASASQIIEVHWDSSSFSDTIDSVAEFRLVYDGTNQTFYRFHYSVAGLRATQVFSWVVAGASTSGAKVCKVQWRSSDGTSLISMDGNDHYSLTAR